MTTERTFAIIKPDAVAAGNVGSILCLIEATFGIDAMRMMVWSKHQVAEFYAEHTQKPFYPGLEQFTTSGPLVCLVLSGVDAVARWRTLMGATNPEEAAFNTIRHHYGKGMPNNAVHGSDSVESTKREIEMFQRWR